MGLSIDSHAVLRAIADHPDAFPAIQPEIDELARKVLGKQLKAKSTDIVLFRRIYSVAGATNVSLILESYQASELAALVKKIDPFSPLAKPADNLKEVRTHIADLATERVRPAEKPEKPAKVKGSKSTTKADLPKIGGVLESKVHSGKAVVARKKKA